MPTTTTTTTSDPKYQRLTALSELAGKADAPDDLSDGLDQLVHAADVAYTAYLEYDYAACEAPKGSAARTILQAARDAAYTTWQEIERAGLPLLQAWQRETLGYSEEEITGAEPPAEPAKLSGACVNEAHDVCPGWYQRGWSGDNAPCSCECHGQAQYQPAR